MTEIFEPHSDKQCDVLLSTKPLTIAATGIQWGKCLSNDTLVLTTEGYIAARAINLDHQLIDRNGNPTNIVGIYPQGLKDCYRIDLTDRKSFTVSDDHLNIIKRRGYAKEEIIKTIDLYNRRTIWEGKSKPQIPAAKPFRFTQKQYLISPYIIGVLLGDGGITNSIVISSIDDELIDRVKSELPDGFKIEKKAAVGCDWKITNTSRMHNNKGYLVNNLTNELRRLKIFGCLSNAKFIPDEYKYGSIQQRIDLLHGLMDTDGTIEKNKKIEFFSVSEQLANDIIYLVESLGGKAWKLEKKSSFTYKGEKKQGQLCYRVNIISPLFNPFWITRKSEKYFVHENTTNKLIKYIEPVGKLDCICFEVDSPTKTYVIEGQVVTHNTTVGVMRLKMAMHEFTHPTDNFIVTSPTYKILYQSTIPPFLYWNKGIGKYDKKNECFQIFGGGKVWFRSGVDPDSVVGITNVRHILCDEAGLYSLYFWENIQARASFKEAPITIVTSPYSLNWLYRDYIRKFRAGDAYIKDRVHLCQAKSSENPYFPLAEYESKRRTMEPRRFNMMFGGNFDKAQGLVYSCFDSSRHWIDPINLPSGTRFFGGIDWGYTHPFVVVVRAVTPLGMHYQVAEIYRTQLMLNEKIDAVHRLKAQWPIEKFYADPANPDDIASFNQAGLRVVPANNDIKKGIEAHWELINEGLYAVFKGSNQHTIDEYEMYHYPEAKDLKPDQSETERSEMPVDKDNHCLIGGSLVDTTNGKIEIENIKVGDYVNTRTGMKKVIFSALTRINTPIMALLTSRGELVLATPDHKIYTKSGFIRMDALKYRDILISIEENKWSQLFGTEKNIADIQNGNIYNGRIDFISKDHLKANLRHCIRMFGNIITDRSDVVLKYIILMVILVIMRLKTWCVSLAKIILKNTISTFLPKERSIIWTESDLSQYRGIPLQKEKNGIVTTHLKQLSIKHLLSKIVLNVTKISKQKESIEQINFAAHIAEQKIEKNQELTTSKQNVSSAKKYSQKINISRKKLVQSHVLMVWQIGHAKKVYDLTVEDDHEFFCNNVLVSNCMDSNRYLTMALFTTSKKPNKIIKSGEQDIIPARTASNYDLNYDKLLKKKRSIGSVL